MRDAFGGVVNLAMIVVFLVLVTGYLAFNVNYTIQKHFVSKTTLLLNLNNMKVIVKEKILIVIKKYNHI